MRGHLKVEVMKTVKAALKFLCSVIVIAFLLIKLSFAQENKICLDKAYENGKADASEAVFDKIYDRVNVDVESFSCYLGIAASQARKAIDAFRYGVLYHDKTRLDSVLQYPVSVYLWQDHKLERKIVIHNFQEWSKLQQTEIMKIHLAVIACSWLGNVKIIGGREPGFFISNGTVWFHRFLDSPKVWITEININPIAEKSLVESCAP
jgi:hypothetical protein